MEKLICLSVSIRWQDEITASGEQRWLAAAAERIGSKIRQPLKAEALEESPTDRRWKKEKRDQQQPSSGGSSHMSCKRKKSDFEALDRLLPFPHRSAIGPAGPVEAGRR